jgi:integrase
LIEAACKEPKAPYLRSFVIISLHTGLRRSELLSLRVEDISIKGNRLKVEDGKGGQRRFVPLDETAKGELIKLMRLQKKAFFS